jgi:hypothetical protein
MAADSQPAQYRDYDRSPRLRRAIRGVPKTFGESAMIDAEDKGVNPARRGRPKTSGFGRSTMKNDEMLKAYREELRRVAREHRNTFAALFAADPKLRNWASRFYASLLPPRRRVGRPRLDSVSIATRLLKTLRKRNPGDAPSDHWKQIYPVAIPDYQAMSRERRLAEQLLLRNRVRSRKNQRRRRSHGVSGVVTPSE